MWGEDWGTMIWGGPSAVPLMSPGGLILLMGAILIIGVTMRRRHAQWAVLTLGAMVFVVPIAAYTGTLSGLIDFTNGTVADANEVNSNFEAVEMEVTENANIIQSNTARIGLLEIGVKGYERLSSSLTCSVAAIINVDKQCSVGTKKLLGGGCSSASAAASLLEAFPLNDTFWRCKFACNLSTVSVTAYAICAEAGAA